VTVQPLGVRVSTPIVAIHPKGLFIQGEWRLICCQSRETLHISQKIAAFDGKIGTLEYAVPPADASGTGSVYMLQSGASHLTHMTPSDINAKWVNGDDIP
jgi:hypothetical protein